MVDDVCPLSRSLVTAGEVKQTQWLACWHVTRRMIGHYHKIESLFNIQFVTEMEQEKSEKKPDLPSGVFFPVV